MKKKKIDIVHIYAITGGVAGLYLDEFYQALKTNFSQVVFVNYRYPFPYGKKWFYKYSDLSASNFKNENLRKTVRFIEIIFSLSRLYIYTLRKEIKVINYSLTSDLLIELWFLKLVKFSGNSKIVITCHDVIPFIESNSNKLKEKIKRKKLFFDLVDFLLIHNENSKDELKKNFNISGDKVVIVDFPLMDYDKIITKKNDVVIDGLDLDYSFKVGMFGYFRREKGVEVLLEAWKEFYVMNLDAKLFLIGTVPVSEKHTFEGLEDNNSIFLLPKYIDDNLLQKLIVSCDVVILPYKRGTNSGIPSSIISCNTLLLTSNIPMFKNNRLISQEFMFKSENKEDLLKKIQWLYGLKEDEKEFYKKNNREKFNKYRKEFYIDVVSKFSIINNN